MFGNEVESGVKRYWSASQAWKRGIGAEKWNYGDLIQELCALKIRRGMLGIVAHTMLQEVIEDHPQPRNIDYSASIVQLPLPFKHSEALGESIVEVISATN